MQSGNTGLTGAPDLQSGNTGLTAAEQRRVETLPKATIRVTERTAPDRILLLTQLKPDQMFISGLLHLMLPYPRDPQNAKPDEDR